MTSVVRASRRPAVPNPFAGMERHRRDLTIVAILMVLAIVYPLVYRSLESALPFIPWPGTAVLITCATFGILALGLNIVMGFAGLLDLGYVAFYAIGAYTTACIRRATARTSSTMPRQAWAIAWRSPTCFRSRPALRGSTRPATTSC